MIPDAADFDSKPLLAVDRQRVNGNFRTLNALGLLLLTSTPLIARNRANSFLRNGNGRYSAPLGAAETAEIDLQTVKYGDTRGAALRVKDGEVQAGPNTLMANVDWSVMPGERWALVGENGCGKSSLLRAITGTSLDGLTFTGSALVQPRTRVGYLVQTAVSGSTKTVKEEAASQMLKLQRAQAALDAATFAVEKSSEPTAEELNMFANAQADFEAAGGYDADARISRVLFGLGFSEADQERTCDQFSGGWQMRIALARLLLSEPDLLLLDEPTNHLDAAAVAWLTGYISSYPGATVVVSHDEALTSQLDCIAEVSRGTLDTYKGGWHNFKTQRVGRARQAAGEYEKLKRKAEELEKFVAKWGASATKASAAQDRKKKLAKVRAEMEKIPVGLRTMKEYAGPSQKLNLALESLAPKTIVGLDNANISYPIEGKENVLILHGVTMEVPHNARILLLGPNGAGKSTLLQAIAGRLPLESGRRYVGEDARIGYFSQDLAQELNLSKTAVQEVMDRAGPRGDEESARGTLGAAGLTGDAGTRRIGVLSGGEKARVALAAFAIRPSHMLLLDEPNNHLDAEMLEVLLQSLASWKGALVVSSHMRSFCEGIRWTHVAHVSEGKVVINEGGLSFADWDWLAKAAAEGESPADKVLTEEELAAKQQRIEIKKQRKKSGNDHAKMRKLESSMEKNEAKVAKLEEEMTNLGSDLEKIAELEKKRAKLQAAIEADFEKYAEIEAKYE